MILRHSAFVKNLLVDSLLFHAAVGIMVEVFHFPFVLVDKNLYWRGFASVLVDKIVY